MGDAPVLRGYGRTIADLWEDHCIHRQNQARVQGVEYMPYQGYGVAPDEYLLCRPTDHPLQLDKAPPHLF